MNKKIIFDYPVFNLGFRAFFALAALSALLLMVLWHNIFTGKLVVANYFSPTVWHAHEMLAGYAVAVMAGFLLTAIKTWTGKTTLTGDALAGLCLVWLYGRLAPFYAQLLPAPLIAFMDLAFLPLLTYHISKVIIQTRYYAGFVFVGILILLAISNGLIHAQALGLSHSAPLGLQLMVATMVMLILIIAGKVLPAFTEKGLTGVLIIPNPMVDNVAIATALLMFMAQLAGVSGLSLFIVASCCALANFVRLWRWAFRKVCYVPLLWVLYSGYLWLIIGFVLIALSAYQIVSSSAALHALTLGGIGLLTLGMMARVALGHTGRALKAANAITLAFALLNLAAFIRVLLPLVFPAWYDGLIYSATLIWLGAFSLFLFIYTPILTRPRIDGLKG